MAGRAASSVFLVRPDDRARPAPMPRRLQIGFEKRTPGTRAGWVPRCGRAAGPAISQIASLSQDPPRLGTEVPRRRGPSDRNDATSSAQGVAVAKRNTAERQGTTPRESSPARLSLCGDARALPLRRRPRYPRSRVRYAALSAKIQVRRGFQIAPFAHAHRRCARGKSASAILDIARHLEGWRARRSAQWATTGGRSSAARSPRPAGTIASRSPRRGCRRAPRSRRHRGSLGCARSDDLFDPGGRDRSRRRGAPCPSCGREK